MIGRLFCTLICLGIFGSAAVAQAKMPVFVSIVPQRHFVQQIGKDLVDVQVMVQPGASPATYEPKPRQMAGLSKAKLYFAVGVPFENAWLDKIAAANPGMKVVRTDRGIEKLAMAEHHHGEDHHEAGHREGGHHEEGHHDGEHHGEAPHDAEHEGGRDPHIWLSPALVKIQARTILEALQTEDPDHESVYAANFKAFVRKIDGVDRELKQTFAGRKEMQFMVFHPSWGYFADAYGLRQVPIEIQGKNPKPAQLKELILHAKEEGIRVVFVQPQFSTKSAELVAREIGGQVVFADPLAEDWIANLREVAGKFEAAMK